MDKDSIEKNLDRLIDWFRDSGNSKMEQSFLDALPEKLDVLFLNIKEQIEELDYNATSKLKIALKRIGSVDFLKGYFESFDKNHNVTGALENHFRELVSKLKDQSKKIKKQKNFEKKKKLYEADKQDRLSEINKTNNMFAEDDMVVKGEAPKFEDNQ